jgi:phage terminase small subunit
MANSERDKVFADIAAGMSAAAAARKHGKEPATVRQWVKRYLKGKAVTPAVTSDKKRDKRDSVTESKKEAEQIDKIIADAAIENTELNRQHSDFCVYYTINNNATLSYLKVYGCSYGAAAVNGHKLLKSAKIAAEIRRLRKIRAAATDFGGDSIIEYHKRILQADINDYVEIEQIIPIRDGKPIPVADPETKEAKPLIKSIVRIRPGWDIDGSIVTEISEGREGIKVKLADKQKSLAFFERYFGLNPADRHREDARDKLIEDWIGGFDDG